jgi:hypothetical protein
LHTFSVTAAGYLEEMKTLTPTQDSHTLNFGLEVDPATCSAPGYLDPGCQPQPGGLLVGNIYDRNTSTPVNDASISSDEQLSDTATSRATPEDPQLDDGYYTLFSTLTGEQRFTASKANYGNVTRAVTIVEGGVAVQDFELPAGKLAADPGGLEITLSTIRKDSYTIVLKNNGTLPATFNLTEVNAPAPAPNPAGPFAAPTRHVSPKRLHDLNASAVYDYLPPPAAALPGGESIQSWSSGLAGLWGIGVDARAGDLWLSSTAAGGGEDRTYRFQTGGGQAGEPFDLPLQGAVFLADLAYVPGTGRFWQMQVGGSNCIIEMDPAGPAFTGWRICPAFDLPQRGLAYNPLDGTFFSGSWTNGILYHFDASGTILDSAATNLNISGLAFHPTSRRLFALSNAGQGYDVYILDVENGYQVLGGFDIAGMEAYQQAGLEIDCAGHLWAANQATGQVFEVDSAEGPACAWSDIPWLEVSPVSGTILPGGQQTLSLSIEASLSRALSAATDAHLLIQNDTPYGPATFPVKISHLYEFLFPLVFKK